MNKTGDIEFFHEKFKLGYNGKPRKLPAKMSAFRTKFMQEELREYEEAVKSNDLAGQLDALVDLVYVVLGTAYQQGFPFDDAWRLVHNANMGKVRALASGNEGLSKRDAKYDVVKPAGWVPPDMRELLDKHMRSRTMKRIRSSGTMPERMLVAAVSGISDIDMDLNCSSLPGRPDLVFHGPKVAVFVDGCFWHGCHEHFKAPSSNTRYWKDKIAANINRDKRNSRDLAAEGWKVLRVWEHEIKDDADACASRIMRLIIG